MTSKRLTLITLLSIITALILSASAIGLPQVPGAGKTLAAQDMAERAKVEPSAALGVTQRVSIDSSGAQGNAASYSTSTSADGRYMAFSSGASNLVSGDTNGYDDVFVRDRQTGQTTLVSIASDGTPGNGASDSPSISADGRYVAFRSGASNLVSGSSPYWASIFVHDRQTSQTTLVSVASDGITQGNDSSATPVISADGRYIVFSSNANNLIGEDINGAEDVFVHDRQTGQTTVASVLSDGTQGQHGSHSPSISADGRYVAFSSMANLIGGGGWNAAPEIFVHDRQTGQTTLISQVALGGYAASPSISGDGRYVAFVALMDLQDIYVYDRQIGQTTRVSVASDGTRGNADSDFYPSISADGRYVAFASDATNLVGGDNNSHKDVFIRDTQTGQTTLISVTPGGAVGNGDSSRPSVSTGGRYVAFTSDADNLVNGDTNGVEDVFVRDLLGGLDCNSNSDTDGDGLLDGWEVCGYDANGDGVIDVDLPAMGANPYKKDIFVEVDYMVKNPETCSSGTCDRHSHRPKDNAIAMVVQAFANAPVSNPNGSTGIVLHVDYGPDTIMNPVTGAKWKWYSNSDSIPHADYLDTTGLLWTGIAITHTKTLYFKPARDKIFHYAVFAHYLGGKLPDGTPIPDDTSGIASSRPGSSFVVSLGSWTDSVGTASEQAGTFMHELGHNLGLQHGGNESQNSQDYKPNYLSVMNYSFQMSGLIVNNQEGTLDYSRFGNIPPLNEAHLNETIGLNGGAAIANYGTRYYCQGLIWQNIRVDHVNNPINWDCIGDAGGTDIRANINDGDYWKPNQAITTLTGFNDWAALVFNGGSIGNHTGSTARALANQSAIALDELTLEQDSSIYRPYRIALNGGGDIVAALGASATRSIVVTNTGALTATVLLDHSTVNGWFNPDAIPVSVTLLPSGTLSIPITLAVPSSRSGSLTDSLIISATIQEAPLMGDSIRLDTRIGPLAWYAVDKVSGYVSTTVSFTDLSVGTIGSRVWNFGDGATSTPQNPEHPYTSVGVYTVTLTVTGPDGIDTFSQPGLIRIYKFEVYLPIIGNGFKPTPNAPMLAAIDNAGGSSSYSVVWNPVAGVATYTLQEDDNASFSSPITAYSGAGTSVAMSSKPAGTYYYRVKATNTYGDSPWSTTRSTTVAGAIISLPNGDFESGRTLWTEFSTHSWPLIMNSGFPSAITPHSGGWVAWLGGDANDISYIQQQVTVLPASPYLAYWHWIASADTCGGDSCGVLINGVPVDTYDLCASANTGDWVKHVVNLGAYAGQSVTLQIRAETDAANNSNLFVDDVVFQSSPAALYGEPITFNAQTTLPRLPHGAPMLGVDAIIRVFPVHAR